MKNDSFNLPVQKMFFNEQGSNFLEVEIERRKRDTADSKYYKSQRGRKGTLKVPLGQVVSQIQNVADQITRGWNLEVRNGPVIND